MVCNFQLLALTMMIGQKIVLTCMTVVEDGGIKPVATVHQMVSIMGKIQLQLGKELFGGTLTLAQQTDLSKV